MALDGRRGVRHGAGPSFEEGQVTSKLGQKVTYGDLKLNRLSPLGAEDGTSLVQAYKNIFYNYTYNWQMLATRATPLSFDDAFGVVEVYEPDWYGDAIKLSPPRLELRLVRTDDDLKPTTTSTLVSSGVLQGDRFDSAAIPGSTDFIVAWVDGPGTLHVRRFTSEGIALDVLNSTEASNQMVSIRVVAFADGSATVLWDESQADGSGYGIRMWRLSAGLKELNAPTAANLFVAGDQQLGGAAARADGGLIVVWDDAEADGSGKAIRARRFKPDGTPAAVEFTVNTITTGTQHLPAVATLDNGDWVVAFVGADKHVWTRRFSAEDEPQPSVFERRANPQPKADQGSPSAARSGAGSILVVYDSDDFEGWTVRSRLLNAPMSTATLSAIGPGKRQNAMVAGGADRFIAVWQAAGQDGDGEGVYGRLVSELGAPLGVEIAVPQSTAGDQTTPAVAMSDDGRFVVAWTAANAEIHARAFDKDALTPDDEVSIFESLAVKSHPAIVMDSAGAHVVVAWQEKAGELGEAIALRKLSDNLTLSEEPIMVTAQSPFDRLRPALAISDSDKLVAVCWEATSLTAENETDIQCTVRSFSNLASGSDPFGAHPVMLGAQANPVMTFTSDDTLVVAWDSVGVDGAGTAVQFALFSQTGEALTPRTVANRTWASDQQHPFAVTQGGDLFIGWQSEVDGGAHTDILYRTLPLP